MRRSASIERALRWHMRPQEPRPKFVMPPRSVMRLTKLDSYLIQCEYKVGDIFTVNYYSRQDGLQCVWLIEPKGESHTWDQYDLLDTFEIVSNSGETDFYGLRKPGLPRP